MAQKRRGKKKKEEFPDKEEVVEKPSKDEYTIAKWMKDKVPNKKGKFFWHNVQYFTGTKAVNALMESKWGQGEKGKDPFFTSREHCIEFLDMMLRHKFFHRAKKVLKGKDNEEEGKRKKPIKEKGEIKVKKSDDKKDKNKKEDEVGDTDNKTVEGEEETKKKKKKIKLEMHSEQMFLDNRDAYVWMYDPLPVYYPLIGTLVVLAAIVICLFPLWPSNVRVVVYYLSLSIAGFLAFIIILALLRSFLFVIIWLVTAGNHRLWILPNLTEDVGFLDSFWPLYQYEYKGGSSNSKSSKSEKGKKKLKDSDDESTASKQNNENVKKDEEESEKEDAERVSNSGDKEENATDSEASSSQSQTSKEYEILDKAELAEHQ